MNPQDKTRLALDCTRWLSGHPRTRHTAQAVLADLALRQFEEQGGQRFFDALEIIERQ